MSSASVAGVDLIEELRLRRWARQNYVPADQRVPEWHSIVTDEMQRRDRELASAPVPSRHPSAYVPLAPTEIRRHDQAHQEVSEPNLLRTGSREAAEIF